MSFSYKVDADLTLVMQSPQDAPLLMPLINANREHIGAHMGWVEGASTLERLTQYLQRDLKAMATGMRNAWLIYYRGDLVGRIGLWVRDPSTRTVELHYWLIETAIGQGIMHRSVSCILDYAFGVLGLHHAVIVMAEKNTASQRVAQRLGFMLEVSKPELQWNADVKTMLYYGLLRDEWVITSEPAFTMQLPHGVDLRLTEVRHARRAYDLIARNETQLRLWFEWLNHGHTLIDERAFIRIQLERYAKGEGMMCMIHHHGQYVGSISIEVDIDDHKAQLGYFIDQSARRQGIATTAIRGLLAYAFDRRELQRIWIRVATDNGASRHLAEKLGMVQELVLREEQLIAGRRVSHVVYSMLRDEWQTQKEMQYT